MDFSDKIRDAREAAGLKQHELAKKIGVSQRTIASYECEGARARPKTLRKLAAALGVSVTYLSDDECTNPLADIEKDGYVEAANKMYGTPAAREMNELLTKSAALFAGGELSQDQKDAYFDAIAMAYYGCKQKAKEKFGRND